MKISRFIKNALILAFISIFAGCSNLIDSKDDSSNSQDANQGKFIVSLGLKSPGTRAIRAFDYSISDIARWTLTLTDESNLENIIKLTTGAQTVENSPSATYDGSAGTITATKIPAGTYTVSLEGKYTKETTDYTISGSAGGVAISADSSGKATILLGPKSTESGTGSISLTFTDSSSGKILSNLASSLKITLTNLSDNTKTFTYEPNSSSNTLTFDSSSLTLSGSGIKSGWYKISFSAGDTYRVYLPDEPSQFVEIADGTQTTATAAISAESGKVYYTDIGGKYNGFTENSRIDLNTLLTNLTEKMPEEGNIFIHFYSFVPYFSDTDLLNSFKEKVGENKKKVIFYDGDGNEMLIIGDNEGSTTTTLKSSASFTSTKDESATFEINAFDLTKNTMIFLYNGTMIDASGVTSYSSKYSLEFVPMTSVSKNNFTAYDSSVDGSKPFLTAGADLSSYISLYDLENGKTATDYTVVTKTETTDGKTIYKHYVQAVGSGTITAESFAEKISVRAAYSSGTSTAYATSAAIPYTNGTLKFGLYEKTTSTSSDGTSTETFSTWSDENATYVWYLNGNALDSTTSTASFNPYQESNINISGTNTVSCSVTISGTTYVAEMSFTFTTARSAAVWFDGINASSSSSATYALKQLADNTDTSTKASELVTATSSPLYCFDSSCNLWTGTYSNSLTLKEYSMNESTGLFNTTQTGSTGTFEISKGTPVDIYYDSTKKCIFVLTVSDTTGYVYAISIYDDLFVPKSNFSLSSDSTTSATPSQIAVNNGKIYIAGSDNKIYATTVNLTYADEEDESNYATLGTLVSVDNNALSNYATSGQLSITDLQIGDGLGNNTSTLYALLRDYYIYSDGYTSDFSCYSRGALVAINTSTLTVNVYGWTDNTTPMSYSSSISGTLYGPGETTTTSNKLYGPTHFAAVVPKKIVILDDGVVYSTVGKVKNKDRLVEFDIDEKSLTRGASVSATAVIASGFTVSD